MAAGWQRTGFRAGHRPATLEGHRPALYGEPNPRGKGHRPALNSATGGPSAYFSLSQVFEKLAAGAGAFGIYKVKLTKSDRFDLFSARLPRPA